MVWSRLPSWNHSNLIRSFLIPSLPADRWTPR